MNDVIITEVLSNGIVHTVTFEGPFSEFMAEKYREGRRDMKAQGLEATLQKWHDEEAVERRKLGLKVQKSYCWPNWPG